MADACSGSDTQCDSDVCSGRVTVSTCLDIRGEEGLHLYLAVLYCTILQTSLPHYMPLYPPALTSEVKAATARNLPSGERAAMVFCSWLESTFPRLLPSDTCHRRTSVPSATQHRRRTQEHNVYCTIVYCSAVTCLQVASQKPQAASRKSQVTSRKSQQSLRLPWVHVAAMVLPSADPNVAGAETMVAISFPSWASRRSHFTSGGGSRP